MGSEHERRGAIWLPAGTMTGSDEISSWVPPTAAALGPDAWDPDDMLLLPLRGADGECSASSRSTSRAAAAGRPTRSSAC